MTDMHILDAPVVEARVLEDRAAVTRRGTAHLPAGRSRWKLSGVAPVLVDKTLSVHVQGATLQNARVRRKLIAKRDEREGAHAELSQQLDAVRKVVVDIKTEIALRAQELEATQTARQLLLGEVGDDVAWGRATPDAWTAGFDAALQRETTLRLELADLQPKLQDAEQEVQDLTRRVGLALSPSSSRETWIELELIAEQTGEAQVEISYLVPSAIWRPQHRATLRDGTLKMETDACVWQRTGEDWTDVKLSFSTERPSLGVEPPALQADFLRTRKKAEVLEVEAREEEIETAGLGRSKQVAPDLPGVDDGGEARLLVAPNAATVPSDGRPYRVHLAQYESKASASWVAFPERDLAVISRSRHEHGGTTPLLAGPVDLVGQSGPVGRTTTLFVAPGEAFELGWGPSTDIRVHREVTRKEGKSKMLSSWIRSTHRVELKLSNTGPTETKVEVTERVPVSEVSQVEIEVDAKGTTEGVTPDQDGFIRWNVTIPAHGQRTLELAYTVSKKEGVRGI